MYVLQQNKRNKLKKQQKQQKTTNGFFLAVRRKTEFGRKNHLRKWFCER
jgi:hypothetical protein